MTTRDFQTRSPMRIFLSYFRPHRGLFLLDMTCAFFISLVDLAFPLISRTAMYHWLPDKRYSVFFTVMAIVLIAFVIRSILFFVVCYWGTPSASASRRTSAATSSRTCRSWASTSTTRTAPASS